MTFFFLPILSIFVALQSSVSGTHPVPDERFRKHTNNQLQPSKQMIVPIRSQIGSEFINSHRQIVQGVFENGIDTEAKRVELQNDRSQFLENPRSVLRNRFSQTMSRGTSVGGRKAQPDTHTVMQRRTSPRQNIDKQSSNTNTRDFKSPQKTSFVPRDIPPLHRETRVYGDLGKNLGAPSTGIRTAGQQQSKSKRVERILSERKPPIVFQNVDLFQIIRRNNKTESNSLDKGNIDRTRHRRILIVHPTIELVRMLQFMAKTGRIRIRGHGGMGGKGRKPAPHQSFSRSNSKTISNNARQMNDSNVIDSKGVSSVREASQNVQKWNNKPKGVKTIATSKNIRDTLNSHYLEAGTIVDSEFELVRRKKLFNKRGKSSSSDKLHGDMPLSSLSKRRFNQITDSPVDSLDINKQANSHDTSNQNVPGPSGNPLQINQAQPDTSWDGHQFNKNPNAPSNTFIRTKTMNDPNFAYEPNITVKQNTSLTGRHEEQSTTGFDSRTQQSSGGSGLSFPKSGDFRKLPNRKKMRDNTNIVGGDGHNARKNVILNHSNKAKTTHKNNMKNANIFELQSHAATDSVDTITIGSAIIQGKHDSVRTTTKLHIIPKDILAGKMTLHHLTTTSRPRVRIQGRARAQSRNMHQNNTHFRWTGNMSKNVPNAHRVVYAKSGEEKLEPFQMITSTHTSQQSIPKDHPVAAMDTKNKNAIEAGSLSRNSISVSAMPRNVLGSNSNELPTTPRKILPSPNLLNADLMVQQLLPSDSRNMVDSKSLGKSVHTKSVVTPGKSWVTQLNESFQGHTPHTIEVGDVQKVVGNDTTLPIYAESRETTTGTTIITASTASTNLKKLDASTLSSTLSGTLQISSNTNITLASPNPSLELDILLRRLLVQMLSSTAGSLTKTSGIDTNKAPAFPSSKSNQSSSTPSSTIISTATTTTVSTLEVEEVETTTSLSLSTREAEEIENPPTTTNSPKVFLKANSHSATFMTPHWNPITLLSPVIKAISLTTPMSTLIETGNSSLNQTKLNSTIIEDLEATDRLNTTDVPEEIEIPGFGSIEPGEPTPKPNFKPILKPNLEQK